MCPKKKRREEPKYSGGAKEFKRSCLLKTKGGNKEQQVGWLGDNEKKQLAEEEKR